MTGDGIGDDCKSFVSHTGSSSLSRPTISVKLPDSYKKLEISILEISQVVEL